MPTPPLTSLRGLAALGLALAVTTGCSAVEVSSERGEKAGAEAAAASSSPTPTPPVVAVSPKNGAEGVLPTAPVSVRATSGTIESVTVTDAKGTTLAGSLQGGTWTSAERLAPSTAYTVTVAAAGSDGSTKSTTSTFTVLKPGVTATYSIVYDGQSVGVGMPVSIQFDSAVTTAKQRAEVEKLVSVKSVPAQQGSWGWLDNRQLMWRPKEYWQPGTKVSVEAPLTGVQTGQDKWVANDASGGFTVGAAAVSTVDMQNHTMTVRQGGKVVRTIPVSTGRPGPETETRSGIKVIMGKEREITMDSETIGIKKGEPGYYKIDTDYNMRVTWTGEFLHSAPWSVGAQGNSNVSHGCVNMAPGNAQWMYENSKVGDIVKFTGSNREFRPDEGIGVWQYSWSAWQKQSALT